MRVVQAFAIEEHERRLFTVDNVQYRRTKLRAYRLMAASSSITYLGMRLTQMVVMIAGAGACCMANCPRADLSCSCCW